MNLTRTTLLNYIKHNLLWVPGALLAGILTGLVGSAFHFATIGATRVMFDTPWILGLLPFGAILTIFIYNKAGMSPDPGVNVVLNSLQSEECTDVKLRQTPLIFFAATFSHFCGASVGRTGSTLQLGGSIGNFFGRLLKLSSKNKKILMMCGMSGVFSAMFATPLAGAFISLEIATVGILPLWALLPTIIASFSARYIGILLGIPNSSFPIEFFSDTSVVLEIIPGFSLQTGLHVLVVAALGGLVSILYMQSLKYAKLGAGRLVKNEYLRAIIFGGILLALTVIVGSFDYNGLGSDMVLLAFAGTVVPWAFLLKILFTAVSVSAGYRGGEIYPAVFIGATFGATYANLVGLSPDFLGAIGVGALFCGITNCPITSFLICIELFGSEGAIYYLLTIAISFITSGRFCIYTQQKTAP